VSREFSIFAALLLTIALAGCTDPDRMVAQGVKDWCKRDVHCGRPSSDPSQVQTGSLPSRDNPSGAPR
jgi:hypothetical protein